jgi:hypothetical protein
MLNEFEFDSYNRVPQAHNYSSICQSGTHPTFVTNKSWQRPFMIVILGNILLIIIILLLMRVCLTATEPKFYLMIGQLVLWDIAYLLTQFLNPGI